MAVQKEYWHPRECQEGFSAEHGTVVTWEMLFISTIGSFQVVVVRCKCCSHLAVNSISLMFFFWRLDSTENCLENKVPVCLQVRSKAIRLQGNNKQGNVRICLRTCLQLAYILRAGRGTKRFYV